MEIKKIVRAKRTRFGRMLCRLLGDRTGAVAMEYVVIALLVAAAVVAIVMVFGRTITGMFSDSITAMSGNPTGAAESRTNRVQEAITAAGQAEETGKTIQTGEASSESSGSSEQTGD